jgi:uncharacterized protein
MTDLAPLLIGQADVKAWLLPKYANRHGLIAGATGTGKTVTLQTLAEQFSRLGVPVFMADVKGDLAGLSQTGTLSGRIAERVQMLGLTDFATRANPVVFWDLSGTGGHPLRTTISEMGPVLLTRLLELSDAQAGVMNVAFKLADEEGLLLLDFEDLRALLQHMAENAKTISAKYGQVSTVSIGTIQRALLALENEGAKQFFGEPALALTDLMRTDLSGAGVINILRAETLILKPKLYSTFLLWLLSELFEQLPEVGDLEKPKLVFFFDEAHLLFNDAPPSLVQRIEQVVRLIRSKGVGIYFVTQSPTDLPDSVLGQLGNRVQHALRAFTPRDQKAVKTAAETFVPNPKIDVKTVITQLGVGEALVSTLQQGGIPSQVERVFVVPPGSRLGPISDAERAELAQRSPVGSKYDTALNRESAFERLNQRTTAAPAPLAVSGWPGLPAASTPAKPAPASRASTRETAGEAFMKSAMRSIGSNLGRTVIRGVLGSIFKR